MTMDKKLVALLLVLVAVTFEATDALAPLAGRAAFMQLQPGSARAAHKAAEALHRQKRSADQQDSALLDEDASQPHSRQKRAVFSGNIIVVGVLSGVAALLCILALAWSIWKFKYHKDDLGAASQ